jgi:hypothetical protein
MKLNLRPLCVILYRPDLGTKNGLPIYGYNQGPVVWIRNDVVDDPGVLAHELEHVRQAWRGLLIFHSLLLCYPPYRAWTEREAMKVQEEA